MCFAEMAAAFPDRGGDYNFLRQAYGDGMAFLFAWSRFAVIHTGSMALLAFTFGDYVAATFDLGAYGGTWLAASAQRSAASRYFGSSVISKNFA